MYIFYTVSLVILDIRVATVFQRWYIHVMMVTLQLTAYSTCLASTFKRIILNNFDVFWLNIHVCGIVFFIVYYSYYIHFSRSRRVQPKWCTQTMDRRLLVYKASYIRSVLPQYLLRNRPLKII